MTAVRPPSKCLVCQVNRVAWTKPRMDFCYTCVPGGPIVAPRMIARQLTSRARYASRAPIGMINAIADRLS